jgi:hypothetical protein
VIHAYYGSYRSWVAHHQTQSAVPTALWQHRQVSRTTILVQAATFAWWYMTNGGDLPELGHSEVWAEVVRAEDVGPA